MRIVIWCGNFSVGGGGRLLANLVPAMARQPDIELVRVVASESSRFKERIDTAGSPNVEIVYYEHDIVTGAGLIADCHVVYYYWPHVLDYRPVDRPTVCTFQDAIILDYVPPFATGTQIRQYWDRSNAWLSNMTEVVVSSQYVKDRLVHHYGAKMFQCHVIPHAISPIHPGTSPVLSEAARARLPAEYIVYPANTSPHKNHHNLLLAYSKFSQRKKYPLVLFGYLTETLRQQVPDWPEHASLPTLVSMIKRVGLQVDADYFPLGYVHDHDVPAIIRNAKGLIMPSLAEGGGSFPVEEALRLGTPVLCSDIPVMREHVGNRTAKIGWFHPESPDSITRALEEFVLHYDAYKSSTLSGMYDPSDTWDQVAARYIHVFRLAYLKYYRMI